MKIAKLYVSSRCMATAFDADENPIEEYTGPLADIGPKLVALGIPYEKIVETIAEGSNLADLIKRLN